jgi:hypothetical protein
MFFKERAASGTRFSEDEVDKILYDIAAMQECFDAAVPHDSQV